MHACKRMLLHFMLYHACWSAQGDRLLPPYHWPFSMPACIMTSRRQLVHSSVFAWTAWYNTWLLIPFTQKDVASFPPPFLMQSPVLGACRFLCDINTYQDRHHIAEVCDMASRHHLAQLPVLMPCRFLFDADTYQDRRHIAGGAFSQVHACRSIRSQSDSAELALKVSEIPSRSDNQRTQVNHHHAWLEVT